MCLERYTGERRSGEGEMEAGSLEPQHFGLFSETGLTVLSRDHRGFERIAVVSVLRAD